MTLRVLDLTDPRWDLGAAAADLTAAERARADRGTPAVRRRRLVVRAALRRLLGGLLGLPPRDVPLRTDRGRPLLPGSGLELSCSASGPVALVAVAAGAPVGVDVERVGDADVADAAAEGWLALPELARLTTLPHAARPAALTRCWTQKEAVLKAWGTGLLRPPSDVVTPVADSGWAGCWWVTPIPVPSGSVASLATDAPSPLDVARLTPGGPR